ncbi:MAG TPA: hypothetical protein VIL37_07490 [Natronosporangium sp.]
MTRLAKLLTRFHTAAGQPRLDAGGQAPWLRVLPVALVGVLIAGWFVAERVGLPETFEPAAPFVVGTERGYDVELRERGIDLPDQLSVVGYDGQWYLIQANDPLALTDLLDRMDAPRYRALRVLYPALGWLFAAGQAPATPYALLAVGMLAFGFGCAVAGRIVSAYGRSPWWGLLFAAVPGAQIGLGWGTAEPLALALGILGISLVLDRRYLLAGLAFAGSALTKETYLAFAAVTAVFLVVDAIARQAVTRRLLRQLAAIVLPGAVTLFGWWVYVEHTLPWVYNPHGALGRFSLPFVGWFEVLTTIARAEYPNRGLFGIPSEPAMVVSFAVLVAAAGLALWLRQSLLAYHAFAWAMFGLIIAGFLLERYGSAQRTLAPSLLVALLFLVTVRFTNRSPAPVPATATPAGERPDPNDLPEAGH